MPRKPSKTKIVRVNLSALTRVEWSALVRVPADMPRLKIDELHERFYEEIDGGEFEPDPEFWEKGESCYVDPNPETHGMRPTFKVGRDGKISRIPEPERRIRKRKHG